LFDLADRDFGEAVTRSFESHAMTGLLNWTDNDEGPIDPEDQIPYALALAQMIDHGIQHRTQVADMLELLGKGLPMALSPFVWDHTQRASWKISCSVRKWRARLGAQPRQMRRARSRSGAARAAPAGLRQELPDESQHN
jgi:hypothetical protein